MEHTARLAPQNAEVLYDLAVIRLAAGDEGTALEALGGSLRINPKLKAQAAKDDDLAALRGIAAFQDLVAEEPRE
jgi:hypothetical protein